MSTAAQVLVLAIAGIALVLIVWLVRRGSLKERFALVWTAIGIGMVALALLRPVLDRLSENLGIESGTTTLFLIAILFLLGLLLHLSVVASRLEEKVRDLAEAHALAEAARQDRASAKPESTIQPADDR